MLRTICSSSSRIQISQDLADPFPLSGVKLDLGLAYLGHRLVDDTVLHRRSGIPHWDTDHDVSKLFQVRFKGGHPCDSNGLGQQSGAALRRVLVHQPVDLCSARPRSQFGVSDKHFVELRKRDSAAVVPTNRVVSIPRPPHQGYDEGNVYGLVVGTEEGGRETEAAG